MIINILHVKNIMLWHTDKCFHSQFSLENKISNQNIVNKTLVALSRWPYNAFNSLNELHQDSTSGGTFEIKQAESYFLWMINHEIDSAVEHFVISNILLW